MSNRVGARYYNFYHMHPDFPDIPLVGMTATEFPTKRDLPSDFAGRLADIEARLDYEAAGLMEHYRFNPSVMIATPVVETEPSIFTIASLDESRMLHIDMVFNCTLSDMLTKKCLKDMGYWDNATEDGNMFSNSDAVVKAVGKVTRSLYGLCNHLKITALIEARPYRDMETLKRSKKKYSEVRSGMLGQIVRAMGKVKEINQRQNGTLTAKANELRKAAKSLFGYIDFMKMKLMSSDDRHVVHSIVNPRCQAMELMDPEAYSDDNDKNDIAQFNLYRERIIKILAQF